MKWVLLLGAHNNASLAALRSLTTLGYGVILGEIRGRRNFASRSRYAKHKIKLPSEIETPKGFRRAVERVPADYILPTNESTALVAAGIPGFLGPDREVMERLASKSYVAGKAREYGLPTPETKRWDEEGLEGFLRARWPVFVKSDSTWIWSQNRLVKGARWSPESREEALQIARDESHLRPIFQERVEGRAWGLSLLMYRGQVLAAFAHERIREVPPWGGPSSAAASAPVPAGILHKLARFLADEGFWGLCMAEFKGPWLLEINPRPWGSIPLALMSGVDFFGLLIRAVEGRPARATAYRVGLRARHLKGDLAHLRLRPGSLGEVLRGPWRFFNLSPEDPLPALAEVLMSWLGA